jgi:hypothetical protein
MTDITYSYNASFLRCFSQVLSAQSEMALFLLLTLVNKDNFYKWGLQVTLVKFLTQVLEPIKISKE